MSGRQGRGFGRLGAISAALALIAGGVAGALSGCAEGQQATCRTGSECSSGVCGANGLCKEPEADGGAADSAPPKDGGPTTDGGVTDSGLRDSGGGTACGNGDDVITEAENPSVVGARATYKASTETDFDPAGTKDAAGKTVWDFTGALPGDRDIVIESLDPKTGWYASSYPTANLTARLSGETELLGVYVTGGGGLRLKGIVSPTNASSSTNLAYDQPITALGYPIQAGATFTSKGLVTGTAQGVTFSTAFLNAYYEQWKGTVDGAGTAKTPFGDFKVQRVRIDLTRTSQFGGSPGLLAASRVSYLFVAECFGVVAAVASKDNETSPTFTRAAEVRRLTR